MFIILFGQLSAYGEPGHAGHAPPQLSTLRWNQRWICWRCGCTKGPGQKIILPIITKVNLDNLQWSLKLLNLISVLSFLITRHSSIWITNDSIHCSLPSQLPNLAKSGIWHCRLQWQCTRSCVTYKMQKRLPMERGWVALYL